MLSPTRVLFIQTLIGLATIGASIWVANTRGEMAATKYAQNEAQRRDHWRTLVTNPIVHLKNKLPDINNIPSSNRQNIDIHESKAIDTDFFYEHLNTGYPQLMKKICRYQESYNGKVNQVNLVYQRASDLLEQKWEADPDFTNMKPDIKSVINQIISNFSSEVAMRFVNKIEPRLVSIPSNVPNAILIASMHIMIYDSIDIEKVVSDLNLILESTACYGELQQLWEDSQPLSKLRNQIWVELNRIKGWVMAGVPLKGSCSAGREANYE